MSYELHFWKQSPGASLPPEGIAGLAGAGAVDGLEPLPIDDILARIKEAFPAARRDPESLHGRAASGEFIVTWSRQHLRVICLGMDGEEMNRFIDIAERFGCPLFDPQTGVRYVEEPV